MLAAIMDASKALIPQVEINKTQDGATDFSARFTSPQGFHKTHRVRVQYFYNDEELALMKGELMPDGSMMYINPLNGMVHTISAERVQAHERAAEDARVRAENIKHARARAHQQTTSNSGVVDVTATAG